MSIGIKICGLRTAEEIAGAATAGATHIGLNLYQPSPRSVTVEQAARLRQSVPPSVKTVLLTVSMEAEEVVQAIARVQPDIVQFHGAETAEGCAALRQHLPCEIWKAVGVKDAASLEKSQRFVGAVDMIPVSYTHLTLPTKA